MSNRALRTFTIDTARHCADIRAIHAFHSGRGAYCANVTAKIFATPIARCCASGGKVMAVAYG